MSRPVALINQANWPIRIVLAAIGDMAITGIAPDLKVIMTRLRNAASAKLVLCTGVCARACVCVGGVGLGGCGGGGSSSRIATVTATATTQAIAVAATAAKIMIVRYAGCNRPWDSQSCH